MKVEVKRKQYKLNYKDTKTQSNLFIFNIKLNHIKNKLFIIY